MQLSILLTVITNSLAHPLSPSLSTIKPQTPSNPTTARPSLANIYAVAGLPHGLRGQGVCGVGAADCCA